MVGIDIDSSAIFSLIIGDDAAIHGEHAFGVIGCTHASGTSRNTDASAIGTRSASRPVASNRTAIHLKFSIANQGNCTAYASGRVIADLCVAG